MDKKLVIWLIGGNASGKTTSAYFLHSYFSQLYWGIMRSDHMADIKKWEENGLKCRYTSMSPFSANLGEFGTTQCAGTDTLNTKEQIVRSFGKAIQKHPVVIVEGIMATGTWIEFLKRDDTYVFLVLLDMLDEDNFKRLRERRSKKTGIELEKVVLSNKTKENLMGKLRGFRSLYKRMQGLVDYSLKFDSGVLSAKEIHEMITKELEKFLLQG